MKYAIVESGGKQYRAVEGGTLEVDRLPVEAGSNFKLEQILLLADGESVTVGTPFVKDNPIWTKVIEHFKGDKVTIFNYSPKKRIRVKTGHRQNYTRLLVEQIGGSELVKRETVKKADKEVTAAAESTILKSTTEKAVKVEKAAPKEKKPAVKAAKPKTPAAKAAKPKTTEKKPSKGAPKPVAKTTANKSSSAKKPATTKKPSTTKKSSAAKK